MKFTRLNRYVALSAMCVASVTSALAATQYATNSFTWDDGTTPAWGSVSGGPYSSVWTSGNDAVFEGFAGTVTLTSPTAHNLTFTTTGYILSGASTLTLVAPSPTITLGSGIFATNGNNTAAVIGGTAGLTKSGAGTLLLNGSAAHTFTGGLTVNGGMLTLDYGNLASPENLIDSGNALTLATGGGLTLTGKAGGTTVQTNSGVTVNAGYSPVIISRNGSSGSATFIMGALTRGAGSVLDFVPAVNWTTVPSLTEIVKTTGINGAALPAAGTSNYFGAWGLWGTGNSTRYAQLDSNGQFISQPTSVAVGANAVSVTSATTVYSAGSGTYALAGNRTGYGLIGNAGSGATATFTLGANTLTLNGILQINVGTLTFSGASGAGGLVVGDENELVVIGNSGTINLNAPIANKPSNSSRVTIGGSATLVSGAQHTYTGGTTLVGGGGSIVPSVSSTGGSAGNPTTGPFGGGSAALNLAGGRIRSTTVGAQTIANTVTISADTTFPNVSSEKTLSFTGPVTLTGGTRTLTGNVGATVNTESVVFSGAIGDGGNGYGLTKDGTGKIILSGENTYTGPTTISAGTLQIGNGGTSGSLSTSSTLTDNATLAFNRSDDLVQGTHFANLIAGSGTISKTGPGRLVLNQANTISNAATVFTLSGGTLVMSNSAALGPAPSAAGSQIISFANAITTCEFAIDSPMNSYNTSFSSGGNPTFVVNRATPGPAVSHVFGAANVGGATINTALGANVSSGTPVISILSVSLTAGAAATATFAPTNADFSLGTVWIGANGANPKGIRLDGVSTGNVITGSISNGLNTVTLTKTNSSTWTLLGENTYTGTTTIWGGILALGATATLSGTPNISVAEGALFDVSAGGFTVNSGQTLTGSGSVNGVLTLASGAKLAPGASVGTLTNSDLTLNSGAILDFEFTDLTGTPNDLVNVTNNNGLTINGGGINLYLAGGTTPFTLNGTYNLFQYAGAIGGAGEGTLTVANAQVGKTYTFGTSGGFVTLTIGDAPEPAFWNVDANGSWATGANWLSGTVPNAPSTIVNFSSTNGNDITAPRTVALDGSKTLGTLSFSNSIAGFTLEAGSGGSLTFNNGSGSATIQDVAGNHTVNVGITLPGAGASLSVGADSTLALNAPITSSGNVSVSGLGTLVLGADNASLSGNTIVTAGSTLQVGSGTSGSLGSATVANSGTLVFNRTDSALNVANTITGSGIVAKAGSGTVALSGANTYSGPTAITNGNLVVSGGSAIGDSSTVAFDDVAGATLTVNNNETVGALAGGGATGGTVDLQANVITVGGSASTAFAGSIVGSGALNKAGSAASTLTLSGVNTYSGGTTNSGGIIAANNNDALGSGALTFNTGGIRLVVNDGIAITNSIIINGGGAINRGLIENSGPGNAVLTNGTITINAGLSGGGDFASTGTGTLTVGNPIFSSSALVSKRIGTVIFSGGGSYTNFSADEGTTRLGANNGLSTAATVDIGISQNALLDLAGYNQTLVGIKRSSTRTVVVTNSSTANDSTLTLTGTSSYPGLINDAGTPGSRVALVVDGGNFTVGGASTFSGGTTIQNAGVVTTTANNGLGTNTTVTISANSTLNLASTATFTASQGLAGSGTVNVALGTGTTTASLNKDNSGFTGTLNVGTNAPSVAGSGKVQLNGALGTGATVNVFNNATVYLTGSTVTQTCAIVLNGGDTGETIGQLRVDNGATWSGPVTLAGDITGTGDGAIGANSGIGIISGNIGESGGPRALVKVGNGSVVLAGSNSFSGITTVSGNGYLGVANTNALSSTASGTVVNSGAGLWLADGVVVSGETISINGYAVGNNRGALQAYVNATNEWAGPVILGSSGTSTYDTRVGAQTNGSLKISGTISDGGGTNFNVTADVNNGRVIVSGTGKNYSGWTQIIRGTLQLGANNVLPITTVLDAHPAGGVPDGSVFDLAGFNQELAGLRRGNASGPATVTNSAATPVTLTVNNSASSFAYDASIAGNLALVKSGTNSLTLSGTNSYTGSTTVSNGTLLVAAPGYLGTAPVLVKSGATLGGHGLIDSSVTVEASAQLAPGVEGIGTLTVADLTLAGGSQTLVELDAALGTNDMVVLTNIAYGGTLAVTNLSLTAVTNGQTFTLFSAQSFTGDFSSISPSGPTSSLVWKFNPTNGVLTAVSGVADYSTNLSISVSGGNLTVAWPDTHLGWYLQSQTNAINVGLSNNWADVPGSETNTSITIPVNPLDPAVFFRMVHTNQ